MARGPRRIAVGVLGLYVHIPFCSAICNYCNFNRGLFDGDLKNRYLDALLTDIRRKADGSPADTIFFGGGTPSLLEPSEVHSVIEACRESFALAPGAEITLEANPETATHDRLRGFRDAGINRLSFGVQSFRDEELQRLSRLHSAAQGSRSLRNGAIRRLRQCVPGSDDVAAAADSRAVALVGRRAH